jgi:hypothetical protein
MEPPARLTTGSERLDRSLGGGFLPGTLVVLRGSTGIGKTVFGLQFAHAGARQEGRAGIVVNFHTRGDSQNHSGYARSMFGWTLNPFPISYEFPEKGPWNGGKEIGEYFEAFEFRGRRVVRSQLTDLEWRTWNAEYQKRRTQLIRFLYGHFVSGARRVVLDGIEPDSPSDPSFQLEVAEEIAHTLVRKEADWLARELFRERYFANRESVLGHPYDEKRICTLILQTAVETLLERLEEAPNPPGDLAVNANTVLLIGYVRVGGKLKRGLRIAKHRGSESDDGVHPFEVTGRGIRFFT